MVGSIYSVSVDDCPRRMGMRGALVPLQIALARSLRVQHDGLSWTFRAAHLAGTR